jgi:hypothetical protein
MNVVLVCGSRDWPDPEAIRKRLAKLPRGTIIIHGAARGADQQAATAARALGLSEYPYPVKWRQNGRYNPSAAFERNLSMLDRKPDLVIAFQRNGSGGTQHTIDNARKRGIEVELHTDGS